MTGYTSALGAQILIELEGEKDAAILEIQTEGAAQVTAASDEADRAEEASVASASVSFDPVTFGPGTGTTTTGSTTSVDSLGIPHFIPAGALLTSWAQKIAAGGAGAVRFMLGSRNSDGTFNLLTDLDSQTTAVTSGEAIFPLTAGGAAYRTTADSYLYVQRSGGTAPTFATRTANSGSCFLVTGKLTGTNKSAAANTTLLAYRLSYSTPRTGKSNYAEIGKLRGQLNAGTALTASFAQGRNPLATGLTVNATTAYFPYPPLVRGGPLEEVSIGNVTVAGDVAIVLASPVGTTQLKIERVFYTSAAGTGEQILTAGTHFPAGVWVEKNWRVGVLPLGATIGYGSGSFGRALQISGAVLEGVTYTATLLTSAAFDIQVTVGSSPLPYETMRSTMGDRLRGSTTTVFERFPAAVAAPPSWTLGGWAVDATNGGLLSPASGANTAWARVATVGQCTRSTRRMRFRINTVSTAIKFGIACGDLVQNDNGGQFVRINTNTQTVEICSWNGTGFNPTTVYSKPIGFTINVGSVARDYTCEVRRKRNRTSVILQDAVNGERCEFSIKNYAAKRMVGYPGILWEAGSGAAGDVTIKWFESNMDVAKDVFAMFVGDSNTDGWVLNEAWEPSYAERIDDIRNNGDIIVLARAGIASAAMLTELNLALAAINSVKYVLIVIGTNDTNQTSLNSNLTSMANAVVAKGGVPVFVTIPPKTGGLYVQTNANIRTGVYGAHPYVDACSAVTTSNDGVNWNSAYVQGDGIHYNGDGMAVLASSDQWGSPRGQFAMDAPFLFEGSLSGYMPVVD